MKKIKKQNTDVLFHRHNYTLEKGVHAPDNKLLTSMIYSLPLNIYAKNSDGRFIFANSYYCKNVGKALSEIIGKTDFDIHPADLAEKYQADDCRIMQRGQTETIEERWQSIGGDYGYVKVLKAPLYDNNSTNHVIGTLGIFWDISERKKAEVELAEERNLLRTLIDNLPDHIYVKDLESKFVLANKAVAQVMGADSPDELIGKTDFDYLLREEAEQFYEDEQRVFKQIIPLKDKEEMFHDTEGNRQWNLTSKLPLKNIKGDVIGLVGTGHNITERVQQDYEKKKLEQKLLHAQKMETIGTLTAGIAHDFNNLLNVINGYTELLLIKNKEDDSNYETYEKILKAGKSAAELVSQLMMFSSKQIVQPKVIECNSVLSNTQKMLRRIIGEKIEIQLSLAENVWNIRIDPSQMEQIIVNLAANARDAMEDGGVLKLTTGNISISEECYFHQQKLVPGDYVCFTFTDSGHGIKKENIGRIFEPFFTTKEKDKGTGLGLATLFGIIQQNGGGIDVESEEKYGTHFKVYLPRSFEKISPAENSSQDSIVGGKEKILVVEDEIFLRELVADILSENGYLVSSAADGYEALESSSQMNQNGYDVIVTDVVMPGMSGKKLADELITAFPHLKVLFMSGYADDEISHYDLSQPGTAFIQKPFGSAELLGAIRKLIDE